MVATAQACTTSKLESSTFIVARLQLDVTWILQQATHLLCCEKSKFKEDFTSTDTDTWAPAKAGTYTAPSADDFAVDAAVEEVRC